MSDSAIERLLAAGLGRRTKIAAWTPPTPRSLQPLLADYEIISLAGRKGMGAVYRGTRRSLDHSVAIKILPSALAGSDPLFAARFSQEARAMARLSHACLPPQSFSALIITDGHLGEHPSQHLVVLRF